MEQLTNKEKALLTYKILQERKRNKEKKKAYEIGQYMIQRNNEYIKTLYKRSRFKACKRGS